MPVTKEIKYFVLNNFLPPVVYHLFNLYVKTLRVQFEGEQKVQKHLENGGRVLLYGWHQRFFGGFSLPTIFAWSPCIIISRSRDGDFISKVVQRIGWMPVRGSRSKGGREASQAMVQGLKEHRIGGHIVDGPTGPPQIIKPGLIRIARDAGAVICPGILSYENAWSANSWDRFMIPKPFSGILFRFGKIYAIPENMDDHQFEAFRIEIEDDMRREHEAADNYWKQ
jgi:hypothetical protein